MNCNCTPKPDEGSVDQRLGGSVVETPVPLSNGLNIPTFGTLRGYSRYYTQCEYIPQNEKLVPAEFIQIPQSEEELNYFQETLVLGVESYPEPILQFPKDVSWERVDTSHWRVYPNPDAKEFYVLFEYQLDYETDEGYSSHFNVTLVGYDSKNTVPFDIIVGVTAGDKVANFTMSLAEPHIELSAENVWLLPENNNMEFVDLKSNLHWKFVF